MAVLENMEEEDAPALIPAPPDLLSLDINKTAGFEDMDGDDAGELYSPNPTGPALSQVAKMMNLIRIAIYNITYMRGLFPEEYFRDSSVVESEMTVKRLIPKDVESRRLIDWIDQGVYDAMQKEYLETVQLCICEKEEGRTIDEYTFTFRYPNASCEEAVMEFRLAESKENGATFKSNLEESTGDQIRRLIRVCATMMSSLDQIPDQRTIQMKLMYYDDVTPEDYEPPMFKSCLDDEIDKDLAQRFGRLCCISKNAPIFLLDSGATHHISCDDSYMTKMEKIKKNKRIELITADGAILVARKEGVIDVVNIHLNQVRYLPKMKFNVVSIGYLDRQGLLISIVNSEVVIIDVSKSIHVGEGYRHRKNNDYILRAMNWQVDDEVEVQQDDDEVEVQQDDVELVPEDNGKIWVIDSCCAAHVTGTLGLLTNPKPFGTEFYTPKGSMMSSHKGSLRNATMKLLDVLYCPASQDNLISVGVLDSQGHRFTFYNGVCTIVCKDTLEEVGWGMLQDSNLLYYLKRLDTSNVISKRKRTRGNKV